MFIWNSINCAHLFQGKLLARQLILLRRVLVGRHAKTCSSSERKQAVLLNLKATKRDKGAHSRSSIYLQTKQKPQVGSLNFWLQTRGTGFASLGVAGSAGARSERLAGLRGSRLKRHPWLECPASGVQRP